MIKKEENISRDESINKLVVTAFFAAITFLGIQIFRVPLPAVVGTPFVHFGHIFVVMGVLLMGGKRGAVSGTLGLVIFDILNGYLQDVPQVFLETIIKCPAYRRLCFAVLKNRAGETGKRNTGGAMICTVLYGCMNILIEFVMGDCQNDDPGKRLCGSCRRISRLHSGYGSQCGISDPCGSTPVPSGGTAVPACIKAINSSITRVLYLCFL